MPDTDVYIISKEYFSTSKHVLILLPYISTNKTELKHGGLWYGHSIAFTKINNKSTCHCRYFKGHIVPVNFLDGQWNRQVFFLINEVNRQNRINQKYQNKTY